MRGEKRAATHRVVQIFGHAPGDGKAVEGRRAPADLIENHEAFFRRVVENIGRLVHLDHESALALRQVVARAHPCEIRKVLSIRFTAIEMTMIVGTPLVWQLGLKQPWFKGLEGRGRGQIQWAIAIRSVDKFRVFRHRACPAVDGKNP